MTENLHRICVSIARKTVAEAVSAATAVGSLADVIEIRLDALTQMAVAPFISQIPQPLLFTNRPTWEGGGFNGTEAERLSPLIEAAGSGCHFVDLELKAPSSSHQAMLAALEKSASRLILSWHNFQETPTINELVGRLSMMQDLGADIAKIVTMAATAQDVRRMLLLQDQAEAMGMPLIAFCMGRLGVISRVATLELGGFMSYCAVNDEEATAPGQLSVATLRRIEALMSGKESCH
jgi:3-dehydroquinate dehydratase-1/3-dehydroquinate dehydratase/shikimate dehydrogenase